MRPCAVRIGHLTRAGMRATLCRPWIRSVRSVFSSNERKARDGADILVKGLGLSKYTIVMASARTTVLPPASLNKEEVEAAVDTFFAQPHTSVRGWETAAEQVLSQAPEEQDAAMIGHGSAGTLLYCHLVRVPISRQYDQPPTNGGNWFGLDRASRHLLHAGWRLIDAMLRNCPIWGQLTRVITRPLDHGPSPAAAARRSSSHR
jgi:hypothetical protein